MKQMSIVALSVIIGMLPAGAVIANGDSVEQVDPVYRLADSSVVGQTTLFRHTNRVNAVIRTSDLDPGSAVTVWWRIYNRPTHCAIPFACESSDLDNPKVDGSQLHATAIAVGESDGTAIVVATLYRTSMRAQHGQPINDSFMEGHLKGRGLRRPLDAEVELLLVSHGRVANPVMDGDQAALEQLLTPGGTKLECANSNAATAGRSYRCGAIQKSNHGKPL